MATSRLCSIPDCGKAAPSNRKGWCEAHYTRWHRHGDPLAGGTSKGEVERYFCDVVMAYDGDECLLWPFAKLPSGYPKMNDGYAHRRVCEEAHGPAPTPEHEAAHSCGNGRLSCVTKRHLSWKTHVENESDKMLHGTRPTGEHHHGAKLSDDDVLEIRSSNEPGIDLAKRFDVSPGHISYVRRSLKR